MKHMVAVMGITAQVRPMEGLYTASAVPTMKPPPTHVAVSQTNKQRTNRQTQLGDKITVGTLATASDCLANTVELWVFLTKKERRNTHTHTGTGIKGVIFTSDCVVVFS